MVKNLPASAGDVRDVVQSLIRRIPWRSAWQPSPVFLSGECPWTEETGRLWSIGSQRVRHDWSNLAGTQMRRENSNLPTIADPYEKGPTRKGDAGGIALNPPPSFSKGLGNGPWHTLGPIYHDWWWRTHIGMEVFPLGVSNMELLADC